MVCNSNNNNNDIDDIENIFSNIKHADKDVKLKIFTKELIIECGLPTIEITPDKITSKINTLKRNMQMVAACFAMILCLSVAKSYPMLFKHTPNDLEQKEISKNYIIKYLI